MSELTTLLKFEKRINKLEEERNKHLRPTELELYHNYLNKNKEIERFN